MADETCCRSRPNPVLFVTTLCYQSMVMVLCAWAAYDVRNNFQMLLLDLMEWIIEVSFILALILVWLSDSLKLVIDEAKREIRDGIFLRNDEERRLYQRYNKISWKFGRYATVFQAAIVVLMFLRPSIHLLAHAGESNATLSYNLPFQAHIFFDYKNHTMRYFLLYMYQIPMIYLGMFHIAEVSYVVTMVLHLCGKFSILCFRIRNVPTKPPSLFRDHIKSVVNQHLELRQTSEILNDNFYLLLLIEYVSCSSRLSLSMYVALTDRKTISLDSLQNLRSLLFQSIGHFFLKCLIDIVGCETNDTFLKILTSPFTAASKTTSLMHKRNTFETDPVAATNFIMYSLDVIAYLYLYSYIGEQLRCESQSVCDALYDIEWTDVSNEDQKLLLICIINGCQAKYLTAGKFYKFSLFEFTKIVKFSVAFLSVLRARME